MNTSRLSNKNRTDIEFRNYGSLPDLFDNQIKAALRINDDEYDFICEKTTDEELGILLDENSVSFSIRRKAIEILNKYLKLYQKTPKQPRQILEPPTEEELEIRRKHIADNPNGFMAFLEDKKKMEKMGSMGEDTSWFFKKHNPEGKIPEGLKHYKTRE